MTEKEFVGYKEQRRREEMGELSPEGELLYRILEGQSRALVEQEMQGRMITVISRWVTAFGIVWLLGMVLACLWALLTGFLWKLLY